MNKHSVFGDQISSLMSAAHSNAARLCSSAVVLQTARFFAFKQMQMGVAEKWAVTEKGGKNGRK